MMRRYRRAVRSADGVISPPVANGQAVRSAEKLVRRAWTQELLRQREHMERAVLAALEACDTARLLLAATQAGSSPALIAEAHATLELALDVHRRSAEARDRVCRAVNAELEHLTGVAGSRARCRPWFVSRRATGRRSPPGAPGSPGHRTVGP